MNNSDNPDYDPNWQDEYQSIIANPSEAVARINPGQRVFIGTGCAQPQVLVDALIARAAELEDIEIVHLLTLGAPPYAHQQLSEHFHINSFFIAGNIKEGIRQGLGDFTPIFLSEIPRLFSSGRLPLDVALIQVTPPNLRGMCSLGISVAITKSAAENAGLVIAQVNPRMPWTAGDSQINIHDLDVLVPAEIPILEAQLPEPNETSRRIAEYVAALIEDNSTIELGIERIPLTVCEFLKNKKNLGIHTEVFSDALIDLVEAGVITGAHKNIEQGKFVTSSCMGTQRLYDYIHCNPIFSFRPSEYVSDPHLISQQHKMVAVNVALEVDLTGQVCANSLEAKFFSGLGNHMDFTHGAARSPGGKSIVALDSTRGQGTLSRIVPHLSRGANVVATCCEVHYVVTEYGVAYLYGKSLQERAMALISVAHPDFRAELLKAALEMNYVSSELASIEGKILIAPKELRATHILDDGTQISFRPMHPTDEKRMRDMFTSLSEDSLYYRFMSKITRIPQKQIQNFVYIDYRSEMALVGTLPAAHGEDIIAIGRYYLDPRTNRAEVAFTVRDEWQNRGIGTFLLQNLINVAKRNGIAGFTAEVLPDNRSMLAVFHKSPCQIQSRLTEGTYHFVLDFT